MAEEVKNASEQQKEDWMQKRWRPAMGWMYMIICLLDFAIFPVLWSLLQVVTKQPVTQWQPLTLQGAGLFHLAMGAVLGIAAFGRTQEKLGGANNGGITLPPNVGTTYTPPPAMGQQPGNFGAPVATTITQSFGTPASAGFGVPAAATWGTVPTTDVTAGWGGKKAPPTITDFPER